MSARHRTALGESTDALKTPILQQHTCTPFSRRALSLHTLKRGVKDKKSLAVLDGLIKCQWSAYSVSPLFTWSNREVKLKRFARRMAECLSQALLPEKGESFEVKYELMSSLVFNKNDEPAVRVTVNLVPDEGEPKRVFIGYLLSWGLASYTKPVELNGVPYLPVMICSGQMRVRKQVCRSLQLIHDCIVTSIHLHEIDRKELGMALLSFMEMKNETVIMSYMIRDRPQCGVMDLEIPSALTSTLSSLIHKRCGRECSLEDVVQFWDEISEQVFDVFRVKVKYCELVKLQIPKAVITADTFRANDVNSMHVILLFLTSKFVLMNSVMPELGEQK